MKTVSISSRSSIDTTINGYLSDGFVVSQRYEELATLQKVNLASKTASGA